MTFGIGAAVGPLVAGAMMEHSGPQALYVFGIGVATTVACFIRQKRRVGASLAGVP
ncbi:hypothetical protein D3C78_1985960 [compost metagenome]